MYIDRDIKIVDVCVLKIDNQFFDTSIPDIEYKLCNSIDLSEAEAWSLGFYSVATENPQVMPATISATYVYPYLVFA